MCECGGDQRVRDWGLRPWRRESFQFSIDPELDTTVRGIVGLYLNPPARHLATVWFVNSGFVTRCRRRSSRGALKLAMRGSVIGGLPAATR